jgi:hypothetical protein
MDKRSRWIRTWEWLLIGVGVFVTFFLMARVQ